MPPVSRPIGPLTGLRPLGPPSDAYGAIVRNSDTLVALGKALFWDVRVGGDSNQACASCHFHAGADTRTVNQLSPGLNVQPTPDLAFGDAAGRTGSGGAAGPNIALGPADFPFHKLADVSNRESAVLFDTNDAVSSQGSFRGTLIGAVESAAALAGGTAGCAADPQPPFIISAGGTLLGTRQVPPRNTPTSVNTAFMFRNFWDGRANNVFNGVNPFGRRATAADPAARVFTTDGATITPQALALENMSAASQAVGPVLSDVEMTCSGRTFADVGRRVLQQRVLPAQPVSADDSAFTPVTAGLIAAADAIAVPGLLETSTSATAPSPRLAVRATETPVTAVAPGSIIAKENGLILNYRRLMQAAFQPKHWNDARYYKVDPVTGTVSPAADKDRGYQLAELNFSLFFGLAVDAYERTLTSDRSPFDGKALSADARAGQAVFEGKGKCVACHDGPLFSKAATWQGDSSPMPVERMQMADPRLALYDDGFYNIGVRPTFEDVGLGNTDPYGNPLSFTRQFVLDPRATDIGVDRFSLAPCHLEFPFNEKDCTAVPTAAELRSHRVAVDGAFKVPSLRNVALTAPYFHNGGQKSLAEVVAFYNRGGDRRSVDPNGGDTTGTGPLGRPVVATASAGLAAANRTAALSVAVTKPLGQAVATVDPVTKAAVTPGMGGSNADPDVTKLGLSATEQAQLVAFLQSLTDRRVACHAAPFDHPALTVPNGHRPQGVGRNADDILFTLPASGADGYAGCDAVFDKLNSGDLFISSPALGAMVSGGVK